MLQTLEIFFLQFVYWFYYLPKGVGLLTIGALGITLVVLQFTRGSKSFWYGSIGLFFCAAEILHFQNPEAVTNRIQAIFDWMSIVHNDRVPVPLFEFIFHYAVAPFYRRTVFEEALFLTLISYSISVAIIAREEFQKTGMVVGEFGLFGDWKNKKQHRPNRSEFNELGSGNLADTKAIAKWTKVTDPELDTALPVTDLRGSEGTAFKTAKLVIPSEQRNRHVLIVAKTGSGKTTKLILPILYNDCMSKVRSTIVIDSKPEMWRKLAAMTRHYNPEKNILLFNPLDTKRSLSWNLLAKIDDDTDAKLIANTIIMATDQPNAKSDTPFFRNNALAVLNAIMVGLLKDHKKGADTLSMPRVHQLIQSGNTGLKDWLAARPEARRTTQTFIDLVNSGSQNADTIMSELSMRVSQWDLPDICATTWLNELDLETIVSQPTLFIVEFKESEIEMLRPMANVIVVELLRFLTKRAENEEGVTLKRPVSLVIDEFASALGRIPDIHVKLNTLRSRNISIVAAIQSTAQVKAIYEQNADSVLAGFSTKIFMPALDQVDSEWASKETGQMTIRFKTQSLGTNKKLIEWFASKNDSTQEQVQQRAVLTPDEIGKPLDNISTFFMPNSPAFQGHLVPYYEIAETKKRFKEFDKIDKELQLREKEIEYTPQEVEVASSAPTAGVNGLPPGISDTRKWTEDQIKTKLEEVKKKLDWENTTGSARKWWEAFENENKHRVNLVLRLAEELQNRKATVTEFFLAYVYSNTDNIQANLCYLDYTRLKKEEEKKRREAAAKAAASSQPPATS
jgi:type IV secretory pathway TraG/TraD family ATPase VirD4